MAGLVRPPLPIRRLLGLTAFVTLLHGWALLLLAERTEALAARAPSPAAAGVWARIVRVPPPRLAPLAALQPAPSLRPDRLPSPAGEAKASRPLPPAPAVMAPMPAVPEGDPVPVADAATRAPDEGEPPPVYPTRVPAPATLRFAARANGVDAGAELRWRHDGERYRLELRVAGAARPLVEQLSEGSFDEAGLAPERFLDRRRGRTVGAAHFRREVGRISFSGPRVDYPAWPGAQDRLAWLAQLVAVLAAAAQPPDELRFFVVDARGVARPWIFRADGRERIDTAAGAVDALRLVREPPRADDLRITVWLDPSRRGWPLRLRWTVPISGADLELTLAEVGAGEPLPAAAGP